MNEKYLGTKKRLCKELIEVAKRVARRGGAHIKFVPEPKKEGEDYDAGQEADSERADY